MDHVRIVECIVRVHGVRRQNLALDLPGANSGKLRGNGR